MLETLLFVGFILCATSSQAQPIVGVVSQTPVTYLQYWLASFAPDGTQTIITNLTTIGLITGNAFAVIPDKNAVVVSSVSFASPVFLLTLLAGSDGGLLSQWTSPDPIVSVQYDTVSMQLFGITVRQGVASLVTVDISSGTLTPVLSNISYPLQAGLSSYCPHCHLYWAVSQDNALVKMNTAAKTISAVPLAVAPQSIVWDYTTDTMYAFTVSGAEVDVVVVDVQTGGILSTVGSFTLGQGYGTGVAGMDVASGTIYASLGQDEPIWVVVDTKAGNITTQRTDPSQGFPINLACSP